MRIESSLALARSAIDIVHPSPDPVRDVRWLHTQRERFLSGSRVAPGVRPFVRQSWSRSMQSSVSPGLRHVQHVLQPRLPERVRQCAEPVMRELAELVQDTGALVILADGSGTVVDARGDADVRRLGTSVFEIPGGALSEELAGTSGIGTAIEEGRGIQLWGAEHFADAFHGFFCTTLPINDPLSRKILGVLNLATSADGVSRAVSNALAQITLGAVLEIERGLTERLAVREQALLFHYLAARRKRAGSALIAFDGRTMIASDAALELMAGSDSATLTAFADEVLRCERPLDRRVALSSGRVLNVVATPHSDGGECVGAILRLHEAPGHSAAEPSGAAPATDPAGQDRDVDQPLSLAAADMAQGAQYGHQDVPGMLHPRRGRPRLSRLEEAELEHLRNALRETGGNRTQAAQLLQIARSTLYLKLESFRLRGFKPLP